MQNKIALAEQVYDWIRADTWFLVRTNDLETRLILDPNDEEAMDEYHRVMQMTDARAANERPLDVESIDSASPSVRELKESELYAQHCSACHGVNGDGNGPATRHLFPRSRNLRTERMRLVSTTNGIPTLDDVIKVIRSGMPGTSMRAYEELGQDELRQLAEEVLRFRREGVREQFVQTLIDQDEEIDEEEVAEVVEALTTPGEVVTIPPFDAVDADGAIARGKELYVSQSCHSCHGIDGFAPDDVFLVDDQGYPAWPRNLVDDAFKGGNSLEAVYLRILLGMPGSPHPANPTLLQPEAVDLARYCISLTREPKRASSNYQRALQATSGPIFHETLTP
jgi:cytochrome c oxidase cbb3-type subunit 2